jgi:hypothetical protein
MNESQVYLKSLLGMVPSYFSASHLKIRIPIILHKSGSEVEWVFNPSSLYQVGWSPVKASTMPGKVDSDSHPSCSIPSLFLFNFFWFPNVNIPGKALTTRLISTSVVSKAEVLNPSA